MKYNILIESDAIQSKVKILGEQLSRDFSGKNPLLVGILKGAFIFMADITRNMSIPHTVDFMAVASYGSSTTTSGVVRILKDLDTPIFQRHVIIIEDIIDSGLTLKYLKRLLLARQPSSLSVCTLLNKKVGEQPEGLVDYTGFEIPNRFVIGYGLDFDQQYRHLPFIAYFEDSSDE